MRHIVWIPITFVGFVVAANLPRAIRFMLSTKRAKGRNVSWILVYWPLLLLIFDFAVLYAIAMTQPRESRTIWLVLISVIAVPAWVVVLMMVRGGFRARRASTAFESIGCGAKVAVVMVHDRDAMLTELAACAGSEPVVQHVTKVQILDDRADPLLVLEWPQVLGACASAEVFDGHRYVPTSLGEGIDRHDGGAEARFLCNLRVRPDASLSLCLGGQENDAARAAAAMAELINTRISEGATSERPEEPDERHPETDRAVPDWGTPTTPSHPSRCSMDDSIRDATVAIIRGQISLGPQPCGDPVSSGKERT